MMDDDAETSPYVACANCGKDVFSGVSECPYCFKDPSGEIHVCSHCGRDILPDAVQCPYCKNFTDDRGSHGASAPKEKKFSKVWVIAAWLAVLGTIAPLLLELWRLWL